MHCKCVLIIEIHFQHMKPCLQVLMRNNVSYRIVGIKIVQIKCFEWVVRILCNVRLVPNLKRIIIFFSTLDSKDTSTLVKLKFSKGTHIVMKCCGMWLILRLEGLGKSFRFT